MITIQTECPDRKEMVRKLSDFLSAPAVYMRTPTYAFRSGTSRSTAMLPSAVSGTTLFPPCSSFWTTATSVSFLQN